MQDSNDKEECMPCRPGVRGWEKAGMEVHGVS